MIDLGILQKECWSIAKHLGYTNNKKHTLKALKREYKELKHSRDIDSQYIAHRASTMQSDGMFLNYYNDFIKNTNHDEIPDFIIIMLSHCEELGIDCELALMNKIRYNKLRDKK